MKRAHLPRSLKFQGKINSNPVQPGGFGHGRRDFQSNRSSSTPNEATRGTEERQITPSGKIRAGVSPGSFLVRTRTRTRLRCRVRAIPRGKGPAHHDGLGAFSRMADAPPPRRCLSRRGPRRAGLNDSNQKLPHINSSPRPLSPFYSSPIVCNYPVCEPRRPRCHCAFGSRLPARHGRCLVECPAIQTRT